jgi:hypothetical protein
MYFARFGNGKQPKISLKQRIVERSKETGAALKSKLKDFQQKRKRREGDKQQTQASAETEDKAMNTKVFGVPIMMAARRSRLCGEIELPTVFRVCIDYLEENGLDQEGIYRVSGVKSRIEAIKAQFDQGIAIILHEQMDTIKIIVGIGHNHSGGRFWLLTLPYTVRLSFPFAQSVQNEINLISDLTNKHEEPKTSYYIQCVLQVFCVHFCNYD